MEEKLKKVILITGTSSGIGRECAVHLAANGYIVYGTTRNKINSGDPASDSFNSVFMDVTDDASVQAAVEKVLKNEGRIDAVVNNAGFGISGPIENTTMEDAIAQLDTNFFGVMRVCKAVLPAMRAQEIGTIINISSIGGLIGLPYQGLYSASKFALEGFSEALYGEVKSRGIDVVLVEPGDFSTPFTNNRSTANSGFEDLVYGNEFARTLSVIESDETNGDNPVKIARQVERILRTSNPRLRYRVGSFIQKVSVVLKKIIPGKIFARLIMDHYKLDN